MLNKKMEELTFLLEADKKDVYNYIKSVFENRLLVNKKSLIYIPKNHNKIALVSHYDTVFDKVKRKMKITNNDIITSDVQGVGIGADDRAGIYSLLNIYRDRLTKNLSMPIMIFTDEEETGGGGANEVVNLIDLSNDVNFLLELDRKGANEVVFYNNEQPEFRRFIEKYGFKENMGSFSDITILGRSWGLCSANLSIGYYSQHTSRETLVVSEMNNTIKKTHQILNDSNTFDQWKLKPITSTNFYGIDDEEFLKYLSKRWRK